ncbi:hypothetical protein FACS189432_02570 [Bacteroidia bacterium]|nr:hypothetical protein FACS189426_00630 [Bacteroidia bacterium]GHT27001.1 hypothetical protein FACS189432_02570 [Bacteroidia bacterium]
MQKTGFILADFFETILQLCEKIIYLCSIKSIKGKNNRVVVIEKKYDRKKINKLIEALKPVKVFDAGKFAGKTKVELE